MHPNTYVQSPGVDPFLLHPNMSIVLHAPPRTPQPPVPPIYIVSVSSKVTITHRSLVLTDFVTSRHLNLAYDTGAERPSSIFDFVAPHTTFLLSCAVCTNWFWLQRAYTITREQHSPATTGTLVHDCCCLLLQDQFWVRIYQLSVGTSWAPNKLPRLNNPRPPFVYSKSTSCSDFQQYSLSCYNSIEY
jgi:hypothetical protein